MPTSEQESIAQRPAGITEVLSLVEPPLTILACSGSLDQLVGRQTRVCQLFRRLCTDHGEVGSVNETDLREDGGLIPVDMLA